MMWRHLFDCPVPTRGGVCTPECAEAFDDCHPLEDFEPFCPICGCDPCRGCSASDLLAARDERDLYRERAQQEQEDPI